MVACPRNCPAGAPAPGCATSRFFAKRDTGRSCGIVNVERVGTFTVVTDGRAHDATFLPTEEWWCPACPRGWPRRCDCYRGMLHAEEQLVAGSWGSPLIMYACDTCNIVHPP